jgi:hypothetical protein
VHQELTSLHWLAMCLELASRSGLASRPELMRCCRLTRCSGLTSRSGLASPELTNLRRLLAEPEPELQLWSQASEAPQSAGPMNGSS